MIQHDLARGIGHPPGGTMRRFTIRSLIALIVASAIGLAALRNASEIWAGLMFLSALTAVGSAILGAALMRGRERAWWLGLAVFGGGYLIISLCPVVSELPTTQLLSYPHTGPEATPVSINLASISFTDTVTVADSTRPSSFGWRSLLPGAVDYRSLQRV